MKGLKNRLMVYGAAALLASGVYAETASLPISEMTRSNLTAKAEIDRANYRANLDSIIDKALDDRNLSYDEQKNIHQLIVGIPGGKGAFERKDLPGYVILGDLLAKNIKEGNKEPLEKAFLSEGLEVKVDSGYNLTILYGLAAVVGFFLPGCFKR